MKYNLFIDDERDPPPDFYKDCFVIVARSSKQAIREITEYGMPGAISFDHDLGGNDTAMVVVDWIIENVLDGKISLPEGFDFKVHSANVIGGQNIESKMRNFLNTLITIDNSEDDMFTDKETQWFILSLMIQIVSEEFLIDKDKGGKPYILHCLWVMNQMDHDDPELMTIAVGHDLLEDKPHWTIERLRQMKFSERVLTGLDILNHRKEDDYLTAYIPKIRSNPDTRKVKRADLRHNSCLTRLKGLREKDFKRMEKYAIAYQMLEE